MTLVQTWNTDKTQSRRVSLRWLRTTMISSKIRADREPRVSSRRSQTKMSCSLKISKLSNLLARVLLEKFISSKTIKPDNFTPWRALEKILSCNTIHSSLSKLKNSFCSRSDTLSSFQWMLSSVETLESISLWLSSREESSSSICQNREDLARRESDSTELRLLLLSATCTSQTSTTETWSLRTSSWEQMDTSCWLTSVLPKSIDLLMEKTPTLSAVHQSTCRLKWLWAQVTIILLIGGLLEFWSTRWLSEFHPSTTKTSIKCTNLFSRLPWDGPTLSATASAWVTKPRTWLRNYLKKTDSPDWDRPMTWMMWWRILSSQQWTRKNCC